MHLIYHCLFVRLLIRRSERLFELSVFIGADNRKILRKRNIENGGGACTCMFLKNKPANYWEINLSNKKVKFEKEKKMKNT